MTPPKEDRLTTANAALRLFCNGTTLELDRGYVIVRDTVAGKPFRRRWMVPKGGDFYPIWYCSWAHGGTCSTALSQLVRWIMDKPVLGLGTWQHWCSEKIGLARQRGAELLNILRTGGYPEQSICVLCWLPGGGDWWNLDGVSGPCCAWTTGCRQKVVTA